MAILLLNFTLIYINFKTETNKNQYVGLKRRKHDPLKILDIGRKG